MLQLGQVRVARERSANSSILTTPHKHAAASSLPFKFAEFNPPAPSQSDATPRYSSTQPVARVRHTADTNRLIMHSRYPGTVLTISLRAQLLPKKPATRISANKRRCFPSQRPRIVPPRRPSSTSSHPDPARPLSAAPIAVARHRPHAASSATPGCHACRSLAGTPGSLPTRAGPDPCHLDPRARWCPVSAGRVPSATRKYGAGISAEARLPFRCL